MRRTIILLALTLLLAAGAAEAQRVNCPRIPSVTNDPLNRSYHAGDTVPAELLDPPFVWVECNPPALPAAARRSARRVVFLSVTVDESGAVVDVRPRGTIDPEGFYDAAVGTVRQWRTNAPRWRGLPVKGAVAVDVTFAPPSATAPASQPAPEVPATQAPTGETPALPPAEQVPLNLPQQAIPQPPQPVAQPVPSTPRAAEPVTRPPEPQVTPVAETPVTRSEPAAVAASELAPPAPAPVAVPAPAPTRATTQRPLPTTEPFVVEYYYKVRWGFAEEFWWLFNRNHWPLLRRQMEMGRILEVRAARPRYHATEDGRWDYRVTIVFRSAGDATSPFDTESLERQLFPDFDAYRREEKRRFELLLAHWDVPILPATLEP